MTDEVELTSLTRRRMVVFSVECEDERLMVGVNVECSTFDHVPEMFDGQKDCEKFPVIGTILLLGLCKALAEEA